MDDDLQRQPHVEVETGWDDAIPFARAYIEAAPDRIIWASDWPHVRWTKPRMMNDAEEVELLYRYVDNDKPCCRRSWSTIRRACTASQIEIQSSGAAQDNINSNASEFTRTLQRC